MGAEKKNTIISRCDEKEKIKLEKLVETELSLPDYCSDIKKILKCNLTAGIHSTAVTGDRVSVRGTAVIRLVYVGDKDKIDCCEKTVEISLSGQCSQCDSKSVLLARAVTDYVNCRAVSQRKVSLSGSISVICSVMKAEKCEIFSGDVKDVEVNRVKLAEEDFICHTEKTFDMSETVALEKDRPSIGKIIRQQACLDIESKKAVDDKLLLKGELTVHCVYCTDDGEGKIASLTHTMPFSQITDLEGIDETCEIKADCSVSQLLVCGKADSSGSGRLLDIAARISCYICGFRRKEYEYISDCYCTRRSRSPLYSSRNAYVPLYSSEKKMTLKQSVQLGAVREICDVWAGEHKTSFVRTQGGALCRISITACFICIDESGVPLLKEKELEFESEIPLGGNFDELEGCFKLQVLGLSPSPVKEGATEVSTEVFTDIRLYGVCAVNYVCELREQEQGGSVTKGPALVVYYCDAEEKLWDIAKKYSAPLEALRQENAVSDDTVRAGTVLLIPC